MRLAQRLFGEKKKVDNLDSKIKDGKVEGIGCPKCGGLSYEHDSYFKDYICANCGWSTKTIPKGVDETKIIEQKEAKSLASRAKAEKPPALQVAALGPILVQVVIQECADLHKVWGRELDDETQVVLFAEFIILIVAVMDRLAFNKFGDPVRSQIINPVVNTVEAHFANQKYFGSTSKERRQYFKLLLADRFQRFASCSSIMGEGMDSLVFTGALHLAETFLDDLPQSALPNVVLETGKVVSRFIITLMAVTPFKAVLDT